MDIDVIEYLELNGIDYKERGKNVGPRDVNTDCPFCGWEMHFGINLDTAAINCWGCDLDQHPRPWFANAMAVWEGIPYQVAVAKLRTMKRGRHWHEEIEDTRAKDTVWPEDCIEFGAANGYHQVTSSNAAFAYLADRGFSKADIDKHQLRFTAIGAPYNGGRIIMPIYHFGKLASWVGRDYTGQQKLRYKNCRRERAVLHSNEVLFGMDRFRAAGLSHLRVVEGAFDAMEFRDDSAVSCQKSTLSPLQRRLIRDTGVETLSVIFDAATEKDRNVQRRALQAARNLGPFIRRIKLVKLKGGDVNELGFEKVLEAEQRVEFRSF